MSWKLHRFQTMCVIYDKSIVFWRSGHIFQSPEGDASRSGGETAAEEVARPKFESSLGGSIGCQERPRMTTDPHTPQ